MSIIADVPLSCYPRSPNHFQYKANVCVPSRSPQPGPLLGRRVPSSKRKSATTICEVPLAWLTPSAKHSSDSTSVQVSQESLPSSEALALVHKFPFLAEAPDLLKSEIFVDILELVVRGNLGGTRRNAIDTSIEIFGDVGQHEYHMIVRIIDLDVFTKKPRLTYSMSRRILIVEFPTPAHEAPLIELNRALVPFLEGLPYDQMQVLPSVELTTPLRTGNLKAAPDISITIEHLSRKPLDSQIVYLGECAFSQGEEALMTKLQLEVDAHPETLLVMMIIITEAKQYHSPAVGSTAWEMFRRRPEILRLGDFVELMQTTDEDGQFLGSIVIGDHPWCRIAKVDYYAWLKESEDPNQALRVSKDSESMAHGTLFPEINIAAVDSLIYDGLLKIRDAIASFTNRVDASADTTQLSSTDIRWNFDWPRCQRSIASAAARTAYHRYQDWYMSAFRGVKRRIEDPDYNDESVATQSAGPQPTGPVTRSMSRAIRQRNQADQDPDDHQVVIVPGFPVDVFATLSDSSDESAPTTLSD